MRRVLVAVALATLALVALAVLASSALPDGLESVAGKLGFASRGSAVIARSPFADYQTRFLRHPWLAQLSAGLVGVGILYGFGLLFGKTLKRRKESGAPRNAR